MKKNHQWNLSYFAIAFVVLTLVQFLFIERRAVQSIPYSQFLQLLNEQKVSDLRVEKDRISGKLQEPIDGHDLFSTVRVDPALATDLAHSGVGFTGVNENTFLSGLLGWLLPFVLIMVIWHFLFRGLAEKQGMGGLMNIGKSRAKVFVERDTGVTFADVAGIDEAKAELVEIVSFLKDKAKYARLGAHIPKGTLLVGPPGTGKTLVAKAIAGEAGVPFFSISGSEFVEMFVGVGAARVHDLFEQARQAAPCIIFIDELDALGKMRGVGAFGGNDEKEQTLNQLLAELDGFAPPRGRCAAGCDQSAMDPVHKVSIVPRAIGSLGYTLQRPTEDHFLISCQMLKDRIVVLMAGRAAEYLAYGQISTGAADDLAHATDIARQLITRFGMSTELGQAVLERQQATYLGERMQGIGEKDYSEQTAREVDLGIRTLLDEAYGRAKTLLESLRIDLDAGAPLLLEKETLTSEDFAPLMPMKLVPVAPRP